MAAVFLSLFIPMNYLTILSLIAVAGGVYFFSVGFQLLARRRLLLATPNSRIRSAALGLVEVNGVATGPYTMPSPITGKPCFLYHTTAWQKRESKNQNWEKVADETLHVPFFIDDTTGQMLVEPLAADLDLRRDFREEYAASFFSSFSSFSSSSSSSSTDEIPPRISAFLARHGISLGRSLRIEECLIKPEDALFIAGTLAENPGIQLRPVSSQNDSSLGHGLGSGSSRSGGANGFSQQSPVPEVVRLHGGAAAANAQGMSQQAKIAAALTRAGITKPEAWSAAGVPYGGLAVEDNPQPAAGRMGAEEFSRNESFEGSFISRDPVSRNQTEISGFDRGFDRTPPVVLMKGENDPTFVISFRSQKEFLGALAWRSAGMICGGAAITVLGFYMLLAQMGLL